MTIEPKSSEIKSGAKPGSLLDKICRSLRLELPAQLSEGEMPYYTVGDSTQAKLRNTLSRAVDKIAESGKLDKLMGELEELDEQQQVLLLTPVQYGSKENFESSLHSQESVFRAFLQTTHSQAQARMLSWCVGLLATADSLPIARLILNNLRFLPNVKNSEAFTKELMEVLESCGAPAQREIIEAIPEVIDDVGHKLTVETLQNLMDTTSAFTGCVLETYACLNMSPELLASIRDELLKRLNSVATEFLPAMMKFLLQTTPTKALPGVINSIRDELLLVAPSNHRQGGGQGQPKNYDRLDHHRMTLETIRSAMSFDERIASAFLSAISSAAIAKPLDLWVLFMAHGLSDKVRIKVESTFRKKVVSGDYTIVLIRTALKGLGDVLSDFFPSIMALAERGVRSVEQRYMDLAVQMYALLFLTFHGLPQRQDLITNLLCHVGSQSESECSAGLDVLVKLAEIPAEFKHLWMFVETVLDHLDHLSKSNARKAWKMFALLIWNDDKSGREPLDEKIFGVLSMVLRKQVTNMRDVYKRSGVIGMATILGQLCLHREGHKPAPVDKLVAEYASAVFGIPDPRYKALAFDELANIFQQTGKEFVPTLSEIIAQLGFALLEDSFLVPCHPKDDVIGEAEVIFNLRGDEDTMAVDVWNCTASSATRDHLICLSPLLRLLQSISVALGQLDSMAGLACAPLLICPPSFMETFEDLSEAQQHRVTLATFHGINWLREVLNSFCTLSNVEIRHAILQRLSQIQELEERLERCLRVRADSFPNVRDPTGALCAIKTGVAAEPVAKKAKAAGKKAGKRQAKKSVAEEGEEEGDHEEEEAAAEGTEDVDLAVDLPRVRAVASHFRAYDLQVASVLSYPAEGDADAVCVLRPFSLFSIVKMLDSYSQILFEVRKPGPFARKVLKEVDFPIWADQKLALTRVFLKICLGEHLGRLSTFVSNWLATPEDGDEPAREWLGEEDDVESRFDHPGLESESADRRRHEFFWYIVPAQRMCFDIFGRIFRWLNDQARAVLEEEAKSYDISMRELLSRFVSGRSPIESGGGSVGASLGDLKNQAWRQMASASQSIQSLCSASHYCDMLDALAEYGMGRKFVPPSLPSGNSPDTSASSHAHLEKTLSSDLSNLCLGYLERKWSAECGGVKAADVRPLLEKCILQAMDPTKMILTIANELTRFTGSLGGEVLEVEQFSTLTRSTLSVYYKTAMACLVKQLKDMRLDKSIVNSTNRKERLLKRSNRLNKAFRCLLQVVKGKKATTQVMASALREGRAFLDLTDRAAPFYGHMVVLNASAMAEHLKGIQTSTKILQQLCNQAKVQGERLLLPLVPQARKIIDKLYLEACRMMESAGFKEALQTGHLRHRDLQGEALSTQVSYWAGPEEDRDEDEGGNSSDMDPLPVKAEGEEEEDEEDVGSADVGGVAGPADEDEEDEEEAGMLELDASPPVHHRGPDFGTLANSDE